MFPLWGNGSSSYLRALSKELIKRGHTVGIVAPDKRKLPSVVHYVVTPPQMGVFVGHPELPNAKKFSDMSGKELGEILLSYLKVSLEAVSTFHPEIIHVFHTAFLPPIGRILKLLFGMRIIITTHGSDLQYLAQDRRLGGLIEDANRFAVAITANSSFTKKLYLQMFGQRLKHKTKIIPGGVDLIKLKPPAGYIEKIDKKFRLKDKKIVLFVGRLIKSKGLEYLIKAAPQIHGTILIIGEGPEKQIMEEEVKKRKITNVVFGGYIGDKGFLHAFYKRADVYVSPTVWEGFGLTILEAMAAHTPVVAASSGGIVSIIKDKINGLLISPRNSTAIAQTVNMLLDNDELRQKLGMEAYKTILQRFAWPKIADQFEQVYKQNTFTTKEYLKIVKGAPDPKILRLLSKLKINK